MIKNRPAYNQKTDLRRSILFTLFQALIPGIVIWIVFSEFTHIYTLNTIGLIIVSISLFVWAFFSTLFFCLLKYTYYDQFTFSIPIIVTVIVLFNLSYTNISLIWYTVFCFLSIITSIIVVNFLVYYFISRKNSNVSTLVKK